MTDHQWEILLNTIHGKKAHPLPVGFVIDSPWLPNWCGVRILDYFTSDEVWLQSNLTALSTFPDAIFLPGFWSEYGMCTEPSAFGVRCTFPADEFPHAHKLLHSADEIETLPLPDPRTDGLLPFVINRLKRMQPSIVKSGHAIRFAVARGPLNIASYLMGSTEFLTTMMVQPERAEALLRKITDFLKNWLHVQMETFPTIDGIFLLDDIIGFVGKEEFQTFGLPYFKELFDVNVSVKFLHNDAPCKISAPFLPEMGVNLFNMGFDVSLNELKTLTEGKVTLLGNIPPRDVLAAGSPSAVSAATVQLIDGLQVTSRVVLSCGGGMPPGVPSANIEAFVNTVREHATKRVEIDK
jgi:uroporphyrinogen-III decarboxylase